ncbi:flavodoxin family protein [Anaerocolumna sp.]|uniref:flavodoxin family protein n=1 Tax=Anaerocolumna sp. TaxID=2041569 RepID=UPI0028AE5600|nr:NAD(P)H-dependent oxidoreductase [Anaerocolumna sp.]
MNTIIINGSPKGNGKNSNTSIICKEFVRGMKIPCEIKCIANSDIEELAHYVENYDTVIIILPLYVHAMPGILMKFIEHLRPSSIKGKSLGFIIQAGFIETAQEKYVERYFESLAKQLNYNYLGTVSKGEAAAIYMFPKMFKKVLIKINELGRIYDETHAFDPKLTKELGKPYQLSKFQIRLYQFLCDIGLNNIGWHKVLKQNKVFDKRLDMPFL